MESVLEDEDLTEYDPLLPLAAQDAAPIAVAKNAPPGTTTDVEGGGNSTVLGCTLNVTNSIIGAGCIGYGGAVARSGGLMISMVLIVLFAVLTKWSFDLLIDLGIQFHLDSYEALGTRAGGTLGRIAVIVAKVLFSFGCMVAYTVIIKDNLAAGIRGMILATTTLDEDEVFDTGFWGTDIGATLLVCVVAMLPLCFLRDVAPLERFSSAKVLIYGGLVGIVIYLFVTLPPQPTQLNFFQKWFAIKAGVFQSMGTMVFAFVASHTQHLFFRSLRPEYRNLQSWKRISTMSVAFSCIIFMLLALFAYMTYWEKTESDLFQQYPSNLVVVNLARIFIGAAMIVTYPMPMFSLRELIVSSLFDLMVVSPDDDAMSVASSETGSYVPNRSKEQIVAATKSSSDIGSRPAHRSWDSHELLTLVLWSLSFMMAITAGSLGDVLNLIGCVSGTLIGFVLPGIFSYQLQGYSRTGTILLVAGVLVGGLGTWFSIQDILNQ